MTGSAYRYGVLLATLVALGLVGSCQKKVEPAPSTTLAVLDSAQSIQNQDLTATSVRVTSLLRSSGNQTMVTIGQLCSATSQSPTLTDKDAYWAGEVRVDALPFRFTTAVSGLLPATRYFTRAYVTNSVGTTYGPTTQFTTLARQPTLLATLARLLEDSLRPKDIGYAFTIYQGATRVAAGSGGLASRETGLGFTIDTKMHVASISKTITAFTLVALAAQRGLKLTEPIAAYLPPYWTQGPGISRITFSDLLTHQSGLTSLGQDLPLEDNEYGSLQQLIAKGVTGYGQYAYQNSNFALLRVLIPALMGYAYTGDNRADEGNTSRLYRQAVDSVVFQPVGLTRIALNQSLEQAANLYSYPYRGERGYLTGDYTGTAGALGWYLSADQAGKLFATVLSSADESVLSTSLKTALLAGRYGCFAGLLGDQSVVYYHDGWQWAASPGFSGSYRGLRTVWMKYPNQVTIVLLVNALNANRLFPTSTGLDIVSYVDQAYSRARQIQNGRTSRESAINLEHAEPH